MSDESPMNLPTQPSEVDYETIHDAVMESQRGRWFLHEYARRNRNADTALLLAAIERIESMLRRQRPLALSPASSFSELRDAIERAKKEPSLMKPESGREGRFAGADGLARALESAIAQLQGAPRPLRDAAYAMREEGVRDRFCVEVEACAADLTRNFTALERAAADILALLRGPATRDVEIATAPASEPAPVSSQPVSAMTKSPEHLPEPAITPAFPPEPQFGQSPPHAAPIPAAPPNAEQTAKRDTLTLDPLLPAVDIRPPAAPQPRPAVAPNPTPVELPFASIGSEAPVSEPVATAPLPAPELPITPTFGPGDFMLEPAPAIAQPSPAPEPSSLAAVDSAPTPSSPAPDPMPAPLTPTDVAPAPATQPASSTPRFDASALAPIIALSAEEKIALFS